MSFTAPFALPPETAQTPCFVISLPYVRHNLNKTIEACGAVEHLMPHIKTHRAPWLIRDMVSQGVLAFKAATPAEVEIAAEQGAREVFWAYPSVNAPSVERVIGLAKRFPDVRIVGLVDSSVGVSMWQDRLEAARICPGGILLRVDLDPGMGRTGLPMDESAVAVARDLIGKGLFGGWHIYDGHVHDLERDVRQKRVNDIAAQAFPLFEQVDKVEQASDLIAGGSYTFDLWSQIDGVRVSPGSWTYSSSQHAAELPEFDWENAAYVLATVISTKNGTITVDAGSKAISPDKPLKERYAGPGEIIMMHEEHSVMKASQIPVGMRLALIPRHACTAAYLYPVAWVLDLEGKWELREQLGCSRL